jgi:predicted KAP-like P-loop ATPase
LLERFMDYVERDIPDEHISPIINVLLDIGDDLVLDSDERGPFDFGNESRITRLVYHLLKRVEKLQRLLILKEAVSQSRGIGVQRYLLAALADEVSKETERGVKALLDSNAIEELKASWLSRIKVSSSTDQLQLLAHKQLPRLLTSWCAWGDPAAVRAWCEAATQSDEGLLSFLSKFCSHTRSQAMGDWAVSIQPRLNPSWLEGFLDTVSCAERLQRMQRENKIPNDAQESVTQYLLEFEMLQVGKNPDGVDAFDD